MVKYPKESRYSKDVNRINEMKDEITVKLEQK